MSFTFPADSNNKAGAVKAKNSGNSFVLPVQDESYDALEVKRSTLVANTDTTLTFSSVMEYFDVRNFGPGDAYLKIDGVATVDGADCVLIAEGTAQPFPIKGTVLHVISSGTPKVQAIGVKNNAI